MRSYDHIVIDQLAHACLMQGARAATANLRFFRHNDALELRRKLRRIRLVEFPALARNRARFRFQVMATHTAEQIDTALDIFCDSLAAARQMVND